MQALLGFMNSMIGRVARVALGISILTVGLALIAVTAGWGVAALAVVAALGVVPILLGLSGRCLLELFARPCPPATR